MQSHTFSDMLLCSSYVYIIGVAGDSGSGKTTFTNAILSIIGSEYVSTITLDDYHRYDREECSQLGITPLSPEANNFKQLARDVADLKAGKSIHKPVYSHKTGKFEEPVLFYPNRFIILEGLHPFANPEIAQYLDYRIFVDPEKEVKYEWKTKRDVRMRNYSPADVVDQIKKREADYTRYVAPQRTIADGIIQISYSGYGKELGTERNVYRISLSMDEKQSCIEDIELNIDLCSLFTRSSHDFSIECTKREVDRRSLRTLIIDGELTHETIEKIEYAITNQTGIDQKKICSGQETVTATDLIRLIITWKIINSRILLEKEMTTACAEKHGINTYLS